MSSPQNLPGDLAALGPDDLAQADLPRPDDRHGRGRVDEIHNPDEQDEKGNEGIDQYIGPVAGWIDFPKELRKHMDSGHGLEERLLEDQLTVESFLILLAADGAKGPDVSATRKSPT